MVWPGNRGATPRDDWFRADRGRGRIQPSVEALLGERARAFDARVGAGGFRTVLLLRLLPVVPFNALNYVAGVSSVPTGPYVGATVVGIVPGTVAITVAGSAASDPSSPAFIVSVVTLVVLSAGAWLSGRRRRRNDERGASSG